MVSVAGGSFVPGDTFSRAAVTVSAFSIDTTEVTVNAYAACVAAGRCKADHVGDLTPDAKRFDADKHCNYGVSGKGRHPMNCVDWSEAKAYCEWKGKRLPTENEWEWAARGGARASVYPWGNELPSSQVCWNGDGTCAVGSFSAGDAPAGIHDLAGNVAEWTSSLYDPKMDSRDVRGGGWSSGVEGYLRVRLRVPGTPASRSYEVGFRCAR